MRYLLLGLLPLACSTASAAPGKPEGKPAPRPHQPIQVHSSKPIIEHGAGCEQELATGGTGSGARGRGGGMRPSRTAVARDEEMSAGFDDGDMVGGVAPSVATPGGGGRGKGGAPAPAEIAQGPSGVRAGEWDDNANYRDYLRWLTSAGKGVARLDVSQRQFLVVSDADGKPVPGCAITVRGSKATASLVTMASGRALLFPEALGIGVPRSADVSCRGVTASAPIDAKIADGVTQIKLGSKRAIAAKRTIDLAFVLDTTGSMAEEIDAVKETIRAVSEQLSNAQTEVRIGLVEYKDRTDCVRTRTFPFSADLAAFARSVDGLSADGGGDTPEDMHAGLAAAIDKLAWRKDAVARMVVVIADAPPHLDYQDGLDYADAAKRAAARGIKLYSVSASGMDDTGQVVMRQLAQFTGGANLFVLRGGAGPQSVGGGDPTSACGGTHANYASGNLDQLILGKIKTELASLDADPTRIAGRGQDENAKPCAERLVIAN